MNRYPMNCFALALIVTLAACGGGGGGGGGGSGGGGGVNIDTPVSITGSNFSQVASLAVRSNLIVADSPNYNEGYPAGAVGNAPLPSVNVMNLSRVQLVEINKVKPNEMVSAELPIGAAPVGGTTNCASGGTKTKTFTDDDNNLTTLRVGDKLVIDYANCAFALQQEANNCVLISETNKNVTLKGAVETQITEVTSPLVYKSQLTYTNLVVTTARGTATINGKLLISLAAGPPQITLTSVDGSPLTQAVGGVTERLRVATIQYNDDQQGCDVNIPNNNNYTIFNTTRGEVASSDLGFVNFTVPINLVGDSDSAGGGFPEAGTVRIDGAGGTFMTIVAAGGSTANVTINGRAVSCPTTPTWLQIFNGQLAAAGCT